jgi:hypothetical protein
MASILTAVFIASSLFASGCVENPPDSRPPEPPGIDAAMLSLQDVRDIARFPALESESGPPSDQPQPDPSAPGPCKAVLDQRVIFGQDVSEFRTVTYSAATDTGPGQVRGVAIVNLAVGRYPGPHAAQSVFDKLRSENEECSTLRVKNYLYDITMPDPATLLLQSSAADVVFRLKASQLVSAVVVGLPESDRIAQTVADSMLAASTG